MKIFNKNYLILHIYIYIYIYILKVIYHYILLLYSFKKYYIILLILITFYYYKNFERNLVISFNGLYVKHEVQMGCSGITLVL